jgi:hypothetical protein
VIGSDPPGEAFKEAAAVFDRACQTVAIDGDD